MRRRRKSESGYALLLVLMIGAILALSLYREIPRVAFESQRHKEQLLIERGEQYKRAIQLFVKVNQRWPNEIKDLENFNNVRFLRKRFIDPMTGKDEWRVVHIANGILQDSALTKKDQTKAPAEPTDSYVGILPPTGQTVNQPGAQGANLAMRRRPSDNNPQGNGDIQPDASVTPQPGQPVPGGQTGVIPPGVVPPGVLPPGILPPGVSGVVMNNGQVGQPGGVQTVNGPLAGRNAAGLAALVNQNNRAGAAQSNNGSSYVGSGSSYMGSGSYMGSTPAPVNNSNLPPQPGAAVNSQVGGVSPYPTGPGANGVPPGFPQPGLQPGQPGSQAPNAAALMINNLLTQPRPGGMPQNTAPGGLIGAGIAGVASTLDSDSIMVYNDRENYSEWEFLYDPTKVKPVMNPVTGQLGTPASQLGNMPTAMPGTPVPPNPAVTNPLGGGGTLGKQ